ncbi:MAG: PKD domain-containing protein [Bacteroidales bacterium]|nr:PKD domain-containing protein [Bacteroidales bacterium]MCF8404210.1 PKD domain-containing protein [Bacteroidales bacterium]
MKSYIYKYMILLLAIISMATECNKEKGDYTAYIFSDFTISPETGPAYTTFTFDGSDSHYFSDLEGINTEYDIDIRWDFDYTGEDDVFWDTEFSKNDITTHEYTIAGNYVVVMQAGHNSIYETKSKTLIVTETANTPPIAVINVEPLEVFIGEEVSLDAGLCWDNEDPSELLEVRWDWENDGNYDTEYTTSKQESHTYSEPGSYTIKLQVKDSGELTGETTQDITVMGPGGEPCPGIPVVTDIEGNEYNTVLIGNQCWMKENLKTTFYNDAMPIVNVEDGNDWFWLTIGGYAWFDNDISWRDKYGALYNYYAVANPGGLCPTGWHIPTKEDFDGLMAFIGGSPDDGVKIKSCRQVNSTLGDECNTTEHPRWMDYSIGQGTDNYGFSGLPAGQRVYWNNSAFEAIGSSASWWSSTETPDPEQRSYYLNLSHEGNVNILTNGFVFGYSVRCIKDQ